MKEIIPIQYKCVEKPLACFLVLEWRKKLKQVFLSFLILPSLINSAEGLDKCKRNPSSNLLS